MSTIAIVPARGGSKGIPHKNLIPVAGRPLLQHTLESALATPSIDRVVVSTDDLAIAELTEALGCEVVLRPEELSGDTASSESALRHVMETLRAQEGYQPERVVFLQATSPLRRATDIEDSIQTLVREDADSLFSASPVHGFVWRTKGEELRPLTYDPADRPRRQEIGTDLVENGSIYVFRPWVLFEMGNRLGGKIAVHAMDPMDSFQIDEPSDLELFERLFVLRQQEKRSLPALEGVNLLVLDFDGVLTDNRVLVGQDGHESVLCHRGDGLGIEKLRGAGVAVVVLSKERNPVVAARCKKLGIECLQGEDDKLPTLQALARRKGLEAAQVAYVGNDVNDLECLSWVGTPIAVADSEPEVLRVADWVTTKIGGHGAVREVCEALLASRARASC